MKPGLISVLMTELPPLKLPAPPPWKRQLLSLFAKVTSIATASVHVPQPWDAVSGIEGSLDLYRPALRRAMAF